MASCATGAAVRRVFKDAGRVCPIDYRIAPDAFAGAPKQSCDVLYVVGGLYGNPYALAEVSRMAEADRAGGLRAHCVFNGDMHWFDKTAQNFENIERLAAHNELLVGNVEAELRRQKSVGVGCGCAYPECTPDDAVSRSNRIHLMLSRALEERPDLKALMAGRAATSTVRVGDAKVAITHGDEQLIGGWGCSRESLMDVLRQDELDCWMAENDVDVLACTHTCSPAALALARGVVVNNGAVGLPNFAGQQFGLVTRIATQPSDDALFRAHGAGVWVECVPVRYDHAAFLAWFDDLWPRLSPAAVSYRDRIVHGPDDCLEAALLGGFEPGPAPEAHGGDTAQPPADTDVAPVPATGAHAAASAHPELAASARVALAPDSDEFAAEYALASLVYFEDMLPDDAPRRTVPDPDTLQVNITARCNLACAHCHVGSNPRRTEAMSDDVLEAILKAARDHHVQAIDITGGAPELHPRFAWFLRQAAATVPHVMVRTNLVILQHPAYAPLLDEYAQLGVEVVASVPSVFASQAEGQRGAHTFDPSLAVLHQLNERGYGRDGKHVLSLVFNPQHPVLPPAQDDLERLYRRRLGAQGIAFDRLLAMANCPIGRLGSHLAHTGELDGYLEELLDTFNPEACKALMCRTQLSVGWDGRVYDCDFNQAMGLAQPMTIFDYASDPARSLERPIIYGNHCFSCTAGHGSSCGGTLVRS